MLWNLLRGFVHTFSRAIRSASLAIYMDEKRQRIIGAWRASR